MQQIKPFSAKEFKKDFPILERKINGHDLVYLDNASTTQKPRQVLEALEKYYRTMNANIHRGVHTLSEEASEAYENTRQLVADFIHAKEAAEIIFTRNATEAFNLVAYSWGEMNIHEGDNIIVSALEHHSNLIPWQQLCKRKKAELRILPMQSNNPAELDLGAYPALLDQRTKLVAISQMSNVLGTLPPLKTVITAAHAVGARVMVDGAQGVAHVGANVQDLDCDFFAFSSHKMLGPTGIGILYGKRELLENMPPFLFGGDMVKTVSAQAANWNDVPWKFEAGTPNIADTIAFAEAIKYIERVGFDAILQHDQALVAYARRRLAQLPGLTVYGPTDLTHTGGVVSFNVPEVHPHDVGSILNDSGVAIRTGHHCAQPLMNILQVPATARMSFYLYNDESDIDAAIKGLEKVYEIFKVGK